MGANVFSLVDPATGLAVEAYQMPDGWQGTGQVIRPPMKNITWQSFFLHKRTGCVGFRNFSSSYDGVGPFLSSPLFQNNSLAAGLLNDLSIFLPMQNVQVDFSDMSLHDTPENRQIVQMLSSQLSPMLRTSFSPLQYHAVTSMVCRGQAYKADMIVNLLCWEHMAGRFVTHCISIQNCYGVAAPAALLSRAQQDMRAILASRQENPQWVQYGTQYTTQQNQMMNAHYDRMSQIVREKNEYIGNIQREMRSSTAASMDRVRQGWHEAITGRTDVVNPYRPSTTVETDNNYNYAWTNSNGDVINTDSVLFNPNADRNLNDVEWTQIK